MQRTLTEKEAENFLEKEGFIVVKRATIKNSEQIKEITKKISFPWVMKASSKKIVHKAHLGGVILNISDEIEARDAFEKLSKIENFEEAVIQEMQTGEEIIIGIKKTSEFNHAIMFGRGGTRVEQEKDISFRIIPANKSELKAMMKEVHFYNTLQEKHANIKLLENILTRIEKLAEKYPSILELDINPLFINSKEAKIADARIVFEN